VVRTPGRPGGHRTLMMAHLSLRRISFCF